MSDFTAPPPAYYDVVNGAFESDVRVKTPTAWAATTEVNEGASVTISAPDPVPAPTNPVPQTPPRPAEKTLLEKLRDVNRQHPKFIDAMFKGIGVMLGNSKAVKCLGFILYIVFWFCLPLLQIVTVIVHGLDSCPIESMIPVYLVVAGSVAILDGFLLGVSFFCMEKLNHGVYNKAAPNDPQKWTRICAPVIYLFSFIWMISSAALYVFPIYDEYVSTLPPEVSTTEQPTTLSNRETTWNPNITTTLRDNDDDPPRNLYCNETLYQVAFWGLCSQIGTFGMIIVSSILFGYVMCLCVPICIKH